MNAGCGDAMTPWKCSSHPNPKTHPGEALHPIYLLKSDDSRCDDFIYLLKSDDSRYDEKTDRDLEDETSGGFRRKR